jgi:hypothetical protein
MATRVPTLANVAASASSVTIFAAQTGVSLRAVYNDSAAILYLNLAGATASTTAYTVQIPAGGYYEFPKPTVDGIVTGIWSSATGAARTTEVN